MARTASAPTWPSIRVTRFWMSCRISETVRGEVDPPVVGTHIGTHVCIGVQHGSKTWQQDTARPRLRSPPASAAGVANADQAPRRVATTMRVMRTSHKFQGHRLETPAARYTQARFRRE